MQFIKEEKGQLIGTPLKLVIAVVIGVAVLGVLLQMMNLVGVMNPHSFLVIEKYGFEGGYIKESTRRLTLVVKDENDGRLVAGAIVELRGAGANSAAVTDKNGIAKLSTNFDIAGAPYSKATITISKEGYSRWTKTYLVKKA
jgi:hypothetical protein